MGEAIISYKPLRTWLDILPEDIHAIIYKHVYAGCLESLKTKYSDWNWRFTKKYYCCDHYSFSQFQDGCLYFSYPVPFPFNCNCCGEKLCQKCWVRSRRDARAHKTTGYMGWCSNCVWNDIG